MNLRKPKWRVIYEQEAARIGATVALMMKRSRVQPLASARQRAWLRMHQELGMSPADIGRRASRHWTTIKHGIAMASRDRAREDWGVSEGAKVPAFFVAQHAQLDSDINLRQKILAATGKNHG